MKKRVWYCLVVALLLSAGVVQAASFKFDFNQDGIFEDPQEVSILESETVTIDIYLNEWTGLNIAGIDYYCTYDPSSMEVVSITGNYLLKTNGGLWDDQYNYIDIPSEGSLYMGVVNYGAGVAGPKVLLHRVVLRCTAANTDPIITATLGDDGLVLDIDSGEYFDVIDAEGVIHQLECNENGDCNDDNVCTVDSCNLDTHECVNDPLPDDTSCDDGLFCNGTDTCQAGVCVIGDPPCPDDANPCNDCNEETDICCSATGFSDPCCDDPACENEDVCLFEIGNYYVDGVNGDNLNDGMTAETAWKTITYALSQVTGDENTLTTIHVAPATYNTDMGGDSETFPLIMKEYVSLQGAGYETTIIDAEQDGSVIEFPKEADIQNVTVDGFTITGGFNFRGGGITVLWADPVISNCAIRNNIAYAINGGGIYLQRSNATIVNCIIENNIAPQQRGGGISIGNESSPLIKNCTIVENGAGCDTDEGGGGISVGNYNTATVINTILWGNYRDCSPDPELDQILVQEYGAIDITYSCIQGGYIGMGNTDQNPNFFGTDYYLMYGSPCIDSATSNDAPDRDLDGNPRYDHSATPNTGGGGSPYYDMGAYEYQGDSDGDGIPDDGDESGVVGDNPCTGGETENCDDNCLYVPNSDQADTVDGDGVGDACDNCPTIPNGPLLGTCVKIVADLTASYRIGDTKDFITCTSDSDCAATGGTCQMEPGDCNGNGLGDVCECYANYTYPSDLKVTAADLGVYINEYGRFDCSEIDPCKADGNNDGKVNLSDLALIKNEYARFDCPALP